MDRPISVTELNEYTKRLLESDTLLHNLSVRGEISGFKHHYSGHCYFTLKDEACKVNCAMFRQYANGLDFVPQDGMKVTVKASASLFARDGAYQLYVTSMKKDGEGDLFRQFEELRQRLMKEGLFDTSRKRQIPFFLRTIGVATSESGAAIHDIIKVSRRRDPNISILLAPCQVQGEGAAEDIARAIRKLNEDGRSKVILVGRGGGSMEDLWCFNEECVARAIAASHIPVISCVGHEVDFTIADFTADLRAATPSAAAEIVSVDLMELDDRLSGLTERLSRSLAASQKVRREKLAGLVNRRLFTEPAKVLLESRRNMLEMLEMRMDKSFDRQLESAVHRLERLETSLSALDPAGVLKRGYAIVKDDKGHVTDGSGLRAGNDIRIEFDKAAMTATIGEIYGKDDI